MRNTILGADVLGASGIDLIPSNEIRSWDLSILSHCVVGSDWIGVWRKCRGLRMLVSDLEEVEQRRWTGIDIIYFPKTGLSWPHETCGSQGRVLCRKTRMDMPDESSRASPDTDTAVVCG
jgi:hypothetical protein